MGARYGIAFGDPICCDEQNSASDAQVWNETMLIAGTAVFAAVPARVAKADFEDQPCIASERPRCAAEGFPPSR